MKMDGKCGKLLEVCGKLLKVCRKTFAACGKHVDKRESSVDKEKKSVDKTGMNVNNFRNMVRTYGLCLVFCAGTWSGMGAEVHAEPDNEIREPEGLYAQSAVLMDADSGRILFAKNGREERAMASTTKIMTCILALENGNLDDTVTASAKAASQPEVHLGVREGEQFRLRDLLYSLMLESHNDAAVIIAEHIGTSVEGFADMMNEKARQAGCTQTHFVTPNGLDAADEEGAHRTTAEDLARIMKYCIMDSPQRNAFLEITRTESYTFTSADGGRSFSCVNHNAFLKMMDGALSGKTGFTGEAGYCYVGALKRDDRTYVVSLLACGWPNNKGYKWSDTKKLMSYGIDSFHYQDVCREVDTGTVPVLGGIPDGNRFTGAASVHTCVESGRQETEENGGNPEGTEENGGNPEEAEENGGNPEGAGKKILLRDDAEISVKAETAESLEAPVLKGDTVGTVSYMLGEEVLYTQDIIADETVEVRDYRWCLEKMAEIFFLRFW